ncbi:Thiol-disulfide isomerase or thioredoxin [Dyella jiangningensis]|uniref:redoxin domain-containing protein n=1 Tax=Dyella sp. AtDHG13 TaxID=1938897 RepID=UPI00088078B7|nr:redoxin domain-containing protein [Dyella sp. AtDHG13]PXV59064.1 thiol-disulfide isomerase/thioredoxin [Dyella sp. AtDHG13]SDL27644.1 Thiol-disulfide isomerase or thioredoxin [Dyella jiangningensis]
MSFLRYAVAAAAFSAALFIALPGTWNSASAQTPVADAPAAGFDGATRWLNSPPLSLPALRGKVVLVEFWTRECINCLHVLPHTKALYDRYAGDGLVVVGVHTPEYDEEQDVTALQQAIRTLGIRYPVAMDNDHRIWNAYGNQYWPAIYLIDREGHVVYRHVGEGDYDQTEAQVRRLLGKA